MGISLKYKYLFIKKKIKILKLYNINVNIINYILFTINKWYSTLIYIEINYS